MSGGGVKKEADTLVAKVWDTLYTWEDWKRITIYGIHFGTTMIRHFLRVYVPVFELRSEYMYEFLKKSIYTITFWYHYINENDLKMVFLADGVSWEGYIRDIAISKGIPTYAIECKMTRMTLNFCDKAPYRYFGKMWKELSTSEQEYGKKWAQEHIKNRLKGGLDEVHYTVRNNNTWCHDVNKSYHLEKNDKLKVVIFPHIFEEDCYWCGSQLFDDNYFSWLCNLGEISEHTPEYDWYIKMHPCAKRRDKMIIDILIEKYPEIKMIPPDISPIQLRDEGVRYALTVSGTIGQELPEIGIQVIMAGENPYSCFDFVWNPASKEEYNNLIYNLDKLEEKTNMDDLYKFYALNYLFYDWDYISYKSLFFNNKYLAMDRLELEAYGKKLGTWMYGEYVREWSFERHNKILNELDVLFEKMDSWRPDILYKKGNYEEI